MSENTFINIENNILANIYFKRPIVITRGKGATLWDAKGRDYIDCMGAYGVCIVGHCHPKVVEAIQHQAATLISCHNSLYNDARARFLQKLINATPQELTRVFLSNSGTEAIEAALKIARKHMGKSEIIEDLYSIKGYFDYGIFTPVQVAAITALDGTQVCVAETVNTYKRRRDAFVDGLAKIDWNVPIPKATMYLWCPVPDKYKSMGSMEFSLKLLREAEVVVSPGVAFGELGDGYIRISLVENEHRINQAVRNIKKCLF